MKSFVDIFENDTNFNIAFEAVYSKAKSFTFHLGLSPTIQFKKIV